MGNSKLAEGQTADDQELSENDVILGVALFVVMQEAMQNGVNEGRPKNDPISGLERQVLEILLEEDEVGDDMTVGEAMDKIADAMEYLEEQAE